MSRRVADKLVLSELRDTKRMHIEGFRDDDIVYYPFGTTSQPAIASTSNLT
ncbi:hypothetical protein PILCRDRAFT_16413 [Piloderma croceum F 1598]|uniref:Uncharacterized protein n=1 Tax=Piloderma croceum (strain F 1598) TaxID=765440 RepID=A0A0C3EWK7_PILCF|nr:hypothetical protein PILCRDRAFT_16413 [Piloderma croceum F 1598]